VTVCSHLAVAEGVEVVVDPGRAGLAPEQVRGFVRGVMAAFAAVTAESAAGGAPEQASEQEQR
jgi:hypothetical protein